MNNSYTTISFSGDSPLKILTTGDNHLGKKQYKNEQRKQDYMDAFKETIDIAINRGFDAIINKGDLFDTPQPDVNTVKQCIESIQKLEKHDIPFLAIVGNHERKQNTQWIELINGLSNIYRLSREPLVLENEAYSTVIYGIDAVRKYQWRSKDISLKDPPETYSENPRITVMHELISPPIQDGIHDYKLQEVFNRLQLDIDVLGLSDYHKPIEQTIDDTLVYYSGSTEKTAYNEQKTHSVVVLSIEDTIHKNRIELESPRPFRVKNISVNPDTTFNDITAQLDEIAVKSATKKPVIVIKLTGTNAIIETNQIIDYMDSENILLTRVLDKRTSNQVDFETELEDHDTVNIENAIDTQLADVELTDQAERLNQIVRDSEVATSNIREKTDEIISGDTQ